jgi:hypothetical protein
MCVCVFIFNIVVWVVILCSLVENIDIMEGYSASIFRVEMCRTRNHLGYRSNTQWMWSLRTMERDQVKRQSHPCKKPWRAIEL